jgi:hypothetical protein
MKNKMKNKENELDKLHELISESIEKYNKIAKKIDYTSRLALAKSSYEIDEVDKNDKRTIEEKVNDDCELTYCDIDRMGADVWFPSSISC